MSNKRKLLILMSACLLLASCKNVKKEEDKTYEAFPKTDEAYASYSLGNIYIGSKSYLDGLTHLTEHDILVEDQRSSKNPNMRIYDSYTISDSAVRKEILEAILEYEKEHPSDWERSIGSMELEWYFHNISYNFSIQTQRSKDVDLDNDAESKYGSVLQKTLN